MTSLQSNIGEVIPTLPRLIWGIHRDAGNPGDLGKALVMETQPIIKKLEHLEALLWTSICSLIFGIWDFFFPPMIFKPQNLQWPVSTGFKAASFLYKVAKSKKQSLEH